MDTSVQEHLDVYAFLKQSSFFSMLSKNALWPLACLAQLRRFSPMEIIIDEGVDPVGIFILKKGTVEIFKQLGPDKTLTLTQLTAGDIIGEISVIDKLKTTASVRAIDEVEAVFISEWDFTTQMHAYPEIGLQLLPVLAHRLRIVYEKMR